MFAEYKDILTVQDVAEMLSIKQYRVYDLIRTGHIRRLNTGKPYLIPKTEVIKFVEDAIIENRADS